MKKKFLAWILSLAISLSVVPFGIVTTAAGTEELPTPVVKFDSTGLEAYTTHGDSVSQWQSTGAKTDNGSDATNQNASKDSPTINRENLLNGYPTVVFNSTTAQLKTHGVMPYGPDAVTTVVAVFKTTSTSTNYQYVFATQNTSNPFMSFGVNIADQDKRGQYNALSSEYNGTGHIGFGAASTDFQILVYSYDQSTGEMRIFLNGGNVITGTGKVTDDSVALSYNNLFIGAQSNSNGSLVGEIAELHVYHEVLSDSQVEEIGSGLADKFGLSWTRVVPSVLPQPVAKFDSTGLSAYTTDGAEVTTWVASADSTRKNNAGNTTSDYPTLNKDGLNGYPTVVFGESTVSLRAYSIMPYGPNAQTTMVAVFKTSDATRVFQYAFFTQDSTPPMSLGVNVADSGKRGQYNAISSAYNGTGHIGFGTATTDFQIVVYTYDQSTGETQVFLNGGKPYTATGNVTTTGSGYKNLFFGAQKNDTNRLIGELAELHVYETILTDAQVEAVGADLADKFALNWTSVLDEPAEEVTYEASLTASATGVKKGDTVTVTLSTDNEFASAGVTLTYPEALKFDSVSLGTADTSTAGEVTITHFGNDGQKTITYTFIAQAVAESATVSIKEAGFSTQKLAATEDLTKATTAEGKGSVTVAIANNLHAVTLPEGFTGEVTVENGKDYTFTKTDDADYYDYGEMTVTVGGTEVTPSYQEGVYTIAGVTGAVVVECTRTAKKYTATVTDNEHKDAVTLPAEQPTYKTDYTFTLSAGDAGNETTDGYYYVATIQIGNDTYTFNAVGDNTIDGVKITDDLTITVSKEILNATHVTVTIIDPQGVATGSGDTVKKGESYTVTLEPKKGYSYTVTVNDVAMDPTGENTYTFTAGNTAIKIEVIATVVTDGMSVSEYVTLDGTAMWLIKMNGQLEDGQVYLYDGNIMYQSQYADAGYVYLVVANTLSLDDAKAKLSIGDGAAVSVVYDYDVNGTGTVDANDAQLVYNMYNDAYNGLTETVTIEKFLRADVTKDGKIWTDDAVAVIAEVLK